MKKTLLLGEEVLSLVLLAGCARTGVDHSFVVTGDTEGTNDVARLDTTLLDVGRDVLDTLGTDTTLLDVQEDTLDAVEEELLDDINDTGVVDDTNDVFLDTFQEVDNDVEISDLCEALGVGYLPQFSSFVISRGTTNEPVLSFALRSLSTEDFQIVNDLMFEMFDPANRFTSGIITAARLVSEDGEVLGNASVAEDGLSLFFRGVDIVLSDQDQSFRLEVSVDSGEEHIAEHVSFRLLNIALEDETREGICEVNLEPSGDVMIGSGADIMNSRLDIDYKVIVNSREGEAARFEWTAEFSDVEIKEIRVFNDPGVTTLDSMEWVELRIGDFVVGREAGSQMREDGSISFDLNNFVVPEGSVEVSLYVLPFPYGREEPGRIVSSVRYFAEIVEAQGVVTGENARVYNQHDVANRVSVFPVSIDMVEFDPLAPLDTILTPGLFRAGGFRLHNASHDNTREDSAEVLRTLVETVEIEAFECEVGSIFELTLMNEYGEDMTGGSVLERNPDGYMLVSFSLDVLLDPDETMSYYLEGMDSLLDNCFKWRLLEGGIEYSSVEGEASQDAPRHNLTEVLLDGGY